MVGFLLQGAKKLCAIVSVSAVLISLSAKAQILSYTTDVGGALNMVTANATGTPLTRVNGAATPGAPCGSGYSVSAFTTATVFNAGLPAVEVTVTPDPGFTLNVSGFSAAMRRSGSGPAAIRFAYSTNGTTWIDQGSDQSPNNGSCGAMATGTWATSISVPAPLQLRFRLYGYNAGSASATLQLQNILINGAVTASPACAIAPGLTAILTTSSSATLSWTAIAGALSYNVRYRPSGSATWAFSGSGSTSVLLSGLAPATVYECEVETVCSSGTSGYGSYALFTTASAGTASASSGKIAVYFNRPVNTAVSSGENAVYLHNAMADTLIAYLNRAKYTVDIAQYNYNQSAGYTSIATAINYCISRGVKVRWIYDGHESNTGLALLDTAVHTLASPTTSTYGLMHNKVVIIDAKSADPNDAVVSTGSTVWGINQFNVDYNNTVFIQDSALAHAYLNHFNMMWGDTGSYPNLTLSKFGPLKTDLGAHLFNIGGKTVELYFSPSDHTDAHIQSAINSANTDIYVGMYTFTMSSDATAIVSKNSAGVYTPVIVDENSTLASAAYPILTSGLGSLLKTQTGAVIYHNKMMVVDPSNTCSDPLVLTGSHNWTNAADTKNDENTLIIHSDTIANIYYQSFHANYSDLGGTLTPIPPCVTASCGTPFGLSSTSVTTGAAILNWTALPGAISYNIQYRVVGSGTWSSSSSATNTLTITALLPATAYEFQVQAVCVSGAGSFTSSAFFTTLALPCSVPTGLTASSIDVDIATLSWVAVTGASGYNIQYRISGASSWTTIATTTNSLTLTGLSTATTYDFQVQVICSSGTSAYSSPSSFTTLTPPPAACPAPGWAVPAATAITGSSATLFWLPVAGAVSYNVRYHIAGAPTWVYASSTGTFKSVSGLSPLSVYEFQVQAVCATGGASIFNASSLFTTTGVSEVATRIFDPSTFQVFPNPASGSVYVSCNLASSAPVSIQVCDITGRVVEETQSGIQPAGNYEYKLKELAKGVYIVKLSTGAVSATAKLVKL